MAVFKWGSAPDRFKARVAELASQKAALKVELQEAMENTVRSIEGLKEHHGALAEVHGSVGAI